MNPNKFLIGPSSQGLRKDLKPFATPDDSFVTLQNAYNYLSKIVRRDGVDILGRLALFVTGNGVTGATSSSYTLNLFTQFSITDMGRNVDPNSVTININSGDYILNDLSTNPGYFTNTGTGLDFNDGVIDYTTSVISLTFTAPITFSTVSITFSYSINQPVMGIGSYLIGGINTQKTIVFDQIYSYIFNSTTNMFNLLPQQDPPVKWSGTNYQQFFTMNYAGSFWATNSKPGFNGVAITGFSMSSDNVTDVTTSTANNFNLADNLYLFGTNQNNLVFGTVTAIGNPFEFTATDTSVVFTDGSTSGFAMDSEVSITDQDGIRYYDGATWVNYNPPLNETTVLTGALMIFPYRGYLIFLNTSESSNISSPINYAQRMRWTQIGTPYYSEPVPPNQTFDPFAARDDIIGRGGAEDAATSDQIIGAAFIRDILVVFFENSTWRIRFTNNSVSPFVWERVNVELGSNSTFSVIPFDKGLMAFGPRGIIISDGNDTVRIDQSIPIDFTKISNTGNGPYRVSGIRSFDKRLNYWAFPQPNGRTPFPNQLLVYNYELKTWSYFDDSYTCFGTYLPTSDITWAEMSDDWSTYTWLKPGYNTNQSFDQTIIAGNQEGFVMQLEKGVVNQSSLNISAITSGTNAKFTIVNHNLLEGNWVKLSGIPNPGFSGDPTYGMFQDDSDIGGTSISLNGRNFYVISVLDSDTIILGEFLPNNAGNVVIGNTSFSFKIEIPYIPIYPGSVIIYVNIQIFQDTRLNGILYTNGIPSGTINYINGQVSLILDTPAASAYSVIFRVVSYQPIGSISTIGSYEGGGYLSIISGIKIQSKYFNFFKIDQKTRVSKIDFYLLQTANGEISCNIYGDSNVTRPLNLPIVNIPPNSNDNHRSNVILSSPNMYQIRNGNETIYRLFCDAIASTLQIELTYSNQQMAVDAINSEPFELNAFILDARAAGRII